MHTLQKDIGASYGFVFILYGSILVVFFILINRLDIGPLGEFIQFLTCYFESTERKEDEKLSSLISIVLIHSSFIIKGQEIPEFIPLITSLIESNISLKGPEIQLFELALSILSTGDGEFDSLFAQLRERDASYAFPLLSFNDSISDFKFPIAL